MQKKNVKKLSLKKKEISKLGAKITLGGAGGPSNGSPCPSVQTLETCESIGTQCGGLTYDFNCRPSEIVRCPQQ
ncbi:hypothetical protein [uncultured Dokdonia sp.]|uniref:hypothetical protein n=1 Tax=uncultured Dokdonia sp. TaxID=575653 RepID=UPI00262A0A85|nr:hypothetical protein [uncultured Dokdonia sp.]